LNKLFGKAMPEALIFFHFPLSHSSIVQIFQALRLVTGQKRTN